MKNILIALITLFFASNAWANSIQTQYHSSGAEVDVIKARVADGVLTVIARYNNESGGEIKEKYPIDDVYYIDPAENKKYHVLKDENGKWIANPVGKDGNIGVVARDWGLTIEDGKKMVVWFKFPAPASGSETVNFVIPNVTPFDGLELSD